MRWVQSIPGVGVRRVYRCRYGELLIAYVHNVSDTKITQLE